MIHRHRNLRPGRRRQYGFATLWTTLAMLPMQTAVQYICAKIGLVTAKAWRACSESTIPAFFIRR